MPVTKTAKRALRSSRRKFAGDRIIMSQLEKVVHTAKKKPTPANLQKAFSLTDRAVKKKILHKNKGARMKSQISKFTKTLKKPKS